MQAKELIKYIKNPELLGPESIPGLQKLVQDFPYFQPGYILLSLAARKWDASVYQQSIKKTAIVVSNREHLYKLIHQSDLEPEIALVEEKKESPIAVGVVLKEEKKEAVVEVPLEEKAEKTGKAEEKSENKNAEAVTSSYTEEKKAEQKVEEKVIPYPEPEITEETIEKEIGKSLVNSLVETGMLHSREEQEIKGDVPGNFADWLKFLKNKGQQEEPVPEKKEEEPKTKKLPEKPETEKISAKQKQKALIDRIIESNPGIIRSKEDQKFFKSDTKAKESLLENEHLVTETLAKIYALQGNINKAIRAYEILSLKFPQKSAYFASLIQKLKEKE
jgi:hypothetical protein